MTNMARSNEIDALVSSVRNLVSNRDADSLPKSHDAGRLVLTPALRVDLPAEAAAVDLPLPEPAEDAQAILANAEDSVAPPADGHEADDDETVENDIWAAGTFHTSQNKNDDLTQPIVADDASSEVSAPAPTQAQDIASLIDQAALRDMIVAVVQEELGGEMGERITHNVRKLVRREINRLIAAQELS